MTVAPHVKPDGKPRVIIIIKKDSEGVFDTTLDGVPALAISLSQAPGGDQNAPWELGHLLAQQWAEAEKMARNR